MDRLLQKMPLALVTGTDLLRTACTSGTLCRVSRWLAEGLRLPESRCVVCPRQDKGPSRHVEPLCL